ncbi:MAG: 4-(cytidine 5'-diphospho)-2-C-methyl-D-erythritol kinase [Candidatus Muirbacterium halophilum]|nr:4-(cytidine 5'-diphospho)-2-C-methyl-D-erythritol kinase [Candidatus Muirbacterium halophilum]MCK9474648.1 4-(cytidine 5'-diphospho)-2-C-methyl-D-erythritol kinase [Candidatus Muirbacterium halophilum]
MENFIIKSPAKINLALDLLYKRQDSFHEIDTIMAKIDFFDTINMKKNDSLVVLCDNVKESDNLIYKAIKNLEELTFKKFNYLIKVQKNIPMGAGLAGGSSNAGVVLRFLGDKYNISDEILYQAGEKTGSDVNFFIYKGNFARCMGKGEIIIPLNLNLKKEFLIVKPDIHSNTAEVYKNFDIKEKNKNVSINNILYKINKGIMVEKTEIFNVLEKPAFKLYNKISECFCFLENKFEFVRMSGSGACFFIFDKNINISLNKELYFLKKVKFLS